MTTDSPIDSPIGTPSPTAGTATGAGRSVLGVGREVQAAIYRRGVFGRRPVVPVEPAALEARRASGG